MSRDDFGQNVADWFLSGLRDASTPAYWAAQVAAARRHASHDISEAEVFAAATGMSERIHRFLIQNTDDKDVLIERLVAIDHWLEIHTAVMLHAIRIRAESRARDKERLATIGQLAASMGHDLRNPLGVIQSSLFLLKRRLAENERVMTHLVRMENQVTLCNRIISDLLEMTRNRPLRLEQRTISSVFEAAVESVPLSDDLTVEIDAPAQLAAEVEPGLMVQCIMNLVQNSAIALATHPDPRITISAAAVDAGVYVAVQDNGPGFPPDIMDTVFEPLVTTRPKGTGLGLALVRSVVARHGGSVTAENPKGGGARVHFVLPVKFSEEE